MNYKSRNGNVIVDVNSSTFFTSFSVSRHNDGATLFIEYFTAEKKIIQALILSFVRSKRSVASSSPFPSVPVVKIRRGARTPQPKK